MGQLDAACFAAAACVNLRLDDDNIGLESVRPFAGLFFRESDLAARSGHAVASEDSFGLVLVNLHQ